MARWLLCAALLAATTAAGIAGADAQQTSSTPFAVIPTPPKSFPLIGGQLDPTTAPQLLVAVAANDAIGVHALLAANASPDETDDYGRSALIYSVMYDNLPIAQMLVGHGANLNIHDKLGKTALHWAAERGSNDMLRLLMDAKAQVDAQNRQGLTPLMVAARNGSAAVVRLLLQYHANPRMPDYSGHDAIDWAANHAAIAQALKVAAAR